MVCHSSHQIKIESMKVVRQVTSWKMGHQTSNIPSLEPFRFMKDKSYMEIGDGSPDEQSSTQCTLHSAINYDAAT